MARANYEFVDFNSEYVVIRDLGPWSNFMTVTNDAEAVVREIWPMLEGRLLYYIDSEGDIGELRVGAGGRFDGFGCGGPNDQK